MGGRKWTDEELVLLEELTEKYPLETVARRLNRTKEAVFLKRQRIGIGGYILYTDPPWQQGRGGKKAARPNSTGTTVPYETMDVPGIMELHRYVTNELMNEKHNVFMWTIDKYLPQTEEIMSLLGYKLHARLIWDKGNGPAPAYTVRFAHEYLLWFYKKGNIILPDKDKRGAFSTVLRENSKRHHSQKPECAYQMLETFFPQAKKLELFARAERDGWDQWGNEL